MLADDFIVKKLKNKELHGLLCNKLSKRVDRLAIERLVLEWIKRLTELLFN
ncbi:hypothetical protein RGC54_05945 [Helicobacter pylori]|nr:hypothetical protein [Helicobacter pylori]MDU9799068.1 hypothetical protein [Helicobacter pylori]